MLRFIIAFAGTILLQPVMGEESLPWHAEDPPPSYRCASYRCANNGWVTLQDNSGDPFADEDDCRRFVSEGGTPQFRTTAPPEPRTTHHRE